MIFENRQDAGRRLADKLRPLAGRPGLLVLGLPRGGVPVAYEVARALDAPLDVFVVRKLGMPGHEEFAIGAVASGDVRVLNDDAIRELGVPDEVIDDVTAVERQELARRERAYRGGRPPLDVRGRTVVVVDDGLATGATMFAAVTALRRQAPAAIIVAAPVGAPDTCDALGAAADGAVCVQTPDPLIGVGRWYHDFEQTSDDEVRTLLDAAARRAAGRAAAPT